MGITYPFGGFGAKLLRSALSMPLSCERLGELIFVNVTSACTLLIDIKNSKLTNIILVIASDNS